jgi:hypothetical protein
MRRCWQYVAAAIDGENYCAVHARLARAAKLAAAHAALAERALRICVAYSDPEQRTLIVTSKAIQQVAAELAALEAK